MRRVPQTSVPVETTAVLLEMSAILPPVFCLRVASYLDTTHVGGLLLGNGASLVSDAQQWHRLQPV